MTVALVAVVGQSYDKAKHTHGNIKYNCTTDSSCNSNNDKAKHTRGNMKDSQICYIYHLYRYRHTGSSSSSKL